MGLPIVTDVLQPEAVGHIEVELGRVQLPRATERIFDVDVNLRTVEGPFTWFDFVGKGVLLQSGPQIGLGAVPQRRVSDSFVWARAQVIPWTESKDVIDRLLEFQDATDLI